jgi:hypothetical protein
VLHSSAALLAENLYAAQRSSIVVYAVVKAKGRIGRGGHVKGVASRVDAGKAGLGKD